MGDFWVLFMFYIGVRGWVVNGKINDKDIGLGVGERSQSVIFFLVSCVLQVQVDDLVIYRCLGVIVVKDSGDIFFRKGICCVIDEEVSFIYSFIFYNYIFDRLYFFFGVLCIREKERMFIDVWLIQGV